MLTVLGPTATGKTALAARLAFELNGEVISADSRQVYRGMNIGTGKDYDDYVVSGVHVPFHLIDIVNPGYEYNIFEYQNDFLKAYHDILARKKLPILCGGSGMYLEAILKGYQLAKPAGDLGFLTSMQEKSETDLTEILKSYKVPHNITDFENRARLLSAIRIAHASRNTNDEIRMTNDEFSFPAITSKIFGIDFPRGLVKTRIHKRLEYRLEHGMIEEVEHLLAAGIPPERLMKYGLEYKFVTLFLTGKLSRSDLFFKLNIAIRQFAKRQMTWFRRMERQGMNIHWLDGRISTEQKLEEIRLVIKGLNLE